MLKGGDRDGGDGVCGVCGVAHLDAGPPELRVDQPAGAPLGLWVEGVAGRPAGPALLGFVPMGCCMALWSRVELTSAAGVASTTRSLAFAFSF